jgi:hypothetical protein
MSRFTDGKKGNNIDINNENEFDIDSIDERSLHKNVMGLTTSRSMDKMLNFHKVKSVFSVAKSKRSRIDTLEDHSIQSMAGPSLSSLISSTSISQILLPVESIKKFDMQCWKAFKKYSRPVGDLPLDACNHGLPAYNLFRALDAISEKVRNLNVESEIEKFQLRPDDTIAWSEFKYFCDNVFEPVLEGKRDETVEWKQMGIPSTPYNQLLRKQRSVGQLSYADLAGRSSTSTLIRGEKVRNVYMPKGDISDAMVRVVRRQKRFHGPSVTRINQDKSVCNTGSQLLFPLQKDTISTMVDPRSSYGDKWLKMRTQRQQQKLLKEQRSNRKNVLALLSRTIINDERNSMKNLLKYREINRSQDIEVRAKLSKAQNTKVAENIKRWKSQNLINKKSAAFALKDAIETSVTESRELLEDELSMKKATKQNSLKLAPYSSTLVEVPVELKDRITFARKLDEWNDARAAVKKYIDNEIDSRFSRLARAKFEANLRTAQKSGRVTLSPIKGEMFFGDSYLENDDNVLFVNYDAYVAGTGSQEDTGLRPSPLATSLDDSAFDVSTLGSEMESIIRSYSGVESPYHLTLER